MSEVEGKFGSPSLLVIQAHQESIQETFIRSSSDFLKFLYTKETKVLDDKAPNCRLTHKFAKRGRYASEEENGEDMDSCALRGLSARLPWIHCGLTRHDRVASMIIR
jgi:hypothetical protein